MELTILLLAINLLFVTSQSTPNGGCIGNCNNHGVCHIGSCACDEGYTGPDCSIQLSSLQTDTMITGSVQSWSWRFYSFTNTQEGATIQVVMHPKDSQSTGDCDIYILHGELPSSLHYDKANIDWGSDATILVENAVSDRWYIGIYANFLVCSYTLTVTIETPNGLCAEGCINGQCVDRVCICSSGWKGTICSEVITSTHLPIGNSLRGSVGQGSWSYFDVSLNKDFSKMEILFNVTSLPILDHDCDVYVRYGGLPTLLDWDYQDASITQFITLNIPNAVMGTWYIGIWGFRSCDFYIRTTVTNDICISQCSAHGTCAPPCNCNSGYNGSYCQNKIESLVAGTLVPGYVDQNTWNYYTFWVDNSQNNVVIEVTQSDQTSDIGDADVYVKLGSPPNRFQYDYVEISLSKKFSLVIPDVVNNMLYIGVFGWRGVGYSLKVNLVSLCPSCIHGNCTNTGICICESGWSGVDCNSNPNILTSGKPVSSTLNSTGEWNFYTFFSTTTTIVVSLMENHPQSSTVGYLYLFIAEANEPTIREYSYLDFDLNKGFHTVQMILDGRDRINSIWFVGVYGSPFLINPISYNLVMWQPPLA